MEIRIGNDIQIVTKITNLESYKTQDVKSIECMLFYTPYNHDCFHHHYTPTEYTIHGCGNPIYNVYPHQHKVWHNCAAPFAFKHILLEYTLDLENGTITSMFEASRQFHCGMYCYMVKIELSEDGYGTDNIHLYTLDFGELFELSHCPVGSQGNVVVKTRPQYKVAWNSSTPVVTKYTAVFKDWNGTTLESQEYQEGEVIIKPQDPERVGFTFTGWYPAVPEVMPAKNVTFTAQYTPYVPPTEHVVYYGTREFDPTKQEFTVEEIEANSKKSSTSLPMSIELSGETKCKWWASKTLQMTECKDDLNVENIQYLTKQTISDYTLWYDYSSSANSVTFKTKFNK